MLDILSQSTSSILLLPNHPVHFIGIGGVGMSGLAKILHEAGYTVSGSDVSENAYTRKLQKLGISLSIGHHASHVPSNAIVCVSTAIDPSNPEVATALAQNLPVLHRSRILREILQGDPTQTPLGHQNIIGITGTHGKTTTTGMTGEILSVAQKDPTVVVGGTLPRFQTNAVFGKTRQVAVAELDESDGSLIQYTPNWSILTNLELDHAEHFPKGMASLFDMLQTYCSQLAPESHVLLNGNCPNIQTLLQRLSSHTLQVRFFYPDKATSQTGYSLEAITQNNLGCYQATLCLDGKSVGAFFLSIPGRHNLSNALAAASLCHWLGIPWAAIAEGLHSFQGMGRRFETVGTYHGALLIDDYAHHPTEVAATLQTAKQLTKGKVIAIFQPHRYTRLQALWSEFLTCFGAADELFLADVYEASEKPIPGVHSEAFYQALLKAPHAPVASHYAADGGQWESLQKVLQNTIQPGDTVLSLGAGNITHLLRNWNTP